MTTRGFVPRAVPSTATADGADVPVRVERLDPALLDRAIVLTPTGDASADAAGGAAGVELLATLPAGARVSVIGGNPPAVLVPLGTDMTAAGRALAETAPGDPTTALTAAARSVTGARRPVVVGLGAALPAADAPVEGWPSDVTLATVRVDPEVRVTTVERNVTGGLSFVHRSDALVGALDTMLADLAAQYRLAVDAPPAARRIDLTLAFADVRATVPAAPGAPTAVTTALAPVASTLVASSVASGAGDGRGWRGLAIAALLVVAVALIAAMVLRRRRPRPVAAPAAAPGARAAAPGPTRPSMPAEREAPLVVLTDDDVDTVRDLLRARSFTLVSSPADALRAVLRDPAATIVVPEGNPATADLVRAAATHDRASGRHTRVVSLQRTGLLIDLTDHPADPAPPAA